MASNYEEVEVVEGPAPIAARITRRRAASGYYQYSYWIFRRYERNGEHHETSWMNRTHASAIAETAAIAAQRIADLPPA